jgi:hypothetical protein
MWLGSPWVNGSMSRHIILEPKVPFAMRLLENGDFATLRFGPDNLACFLLKVDQLVTMTKSIAPSWYIFW